MGIGPKATYFILIKVKADFLVIHTFPSGWKLSRMVPEFLVWFWASLLVVAALG
jgi:hypothetical protein